MWFVGLVIVTFLNTRGVEQKPRLLSDHEKIKLFKFIKKTSKKKKIIIIIIK
jgi:hypothetical protein